MIDQGLHVLLDQSGVRLLGDDEVAVEVECQREHWVAAGWDNSNPNKLSAVFMEVTITPEEWTRIHVMKDGLSPPDDDFDDGDYFDDDDDDDDDFDDWDEDEEVDEDDDWDENEDEEEEEEDDWDEDEEVEDDLEA